MTAEIDWAVADQAASRLGTVTRQLVASRDADLASDWCARMAVQTTGSFNEPRAASYLELAVLLGAPGPEIPEEEEA